MSVCFFFNEKNMNILGKFFKGSWEAIFRVTDDFTHNAGWCASLHHITIRLVRLYSMQGGVEVYIT